MRQHSLRRNNPAQRMPPRQHDAAMIHFNRRCVRRIRAIELARSTSAPPQAGHQSAFVSSASTAWHWLQIRSISKDYCTAHSSRPASLFPRSLAPRFPVLVHWSHAPSGSPASRLTWTARCCRRSRRKSASATRRRSGPRRQRASRWPSPPAAARPTRLPLLEGLGLRADTPLITSNGAVLCTLGGETIDRCHMDARVARGLCGLLRPFGSVVFTFDRPGRGELVLEDLEKANGRFALWVEANRNAIEVVKPLESGAGRWRRSHSGHGGRKHRAR